MLVITEVSRIADLGELHPHAFLDDVAHLTPKVSLGVWSDRLAAGSQESRAGKAAAWEHVLRNL